MVQQQSFELPCFAECPKLELLEAKGSTLWTCCPFVLLDFGRGTLPALPEVLDVWQVGHPVFSLKAKAPHSLSMLHTWHRAHAGKVLWTRHNMSQSLKGRLLTLMCPSHVLSSCPD